MLFRYEYKTITAKRCATPDNSAASKALRLAAELFIRLRPSRSGVSARTIANGAASFGRWEYALPVVFHANDCPAASLGLVHKGLRECTDLGIRQPSRRPVSIFAIRVVVMDEHFQPRPVPRARPFQHLAVTGGIAESGVGALADEEIDSDHLAAE